MRAVLLLIGSAVGSIAFQVTVALWPDKLHSYAWAVKYVWIIWVVIWLLWLMHWWTARQYQMNPTAPKTTTASDRASTLVSPAAAISPVPPAPTSPPGARQQQLLRDEPNLIFLNTRRIRITFDVNEVFRTSTDVADPPAVVACFRNEPVPGRRVIDADLVKAQILYRNARGEEIGNGIPSACWLDEPADMTNFRAGESHCVILVAAGPDGLLSVPWKARRGADDGWGGDVVSTEAYELDDVASTIELRIIGERNDVLVVVRFDCTMVDGKPHAVRRP